MDLLTTIGSAVTTAGNIYGLVKDLKNEELLRQIGSLSRELAQAETEIAGLMHRNLSLEQENQGLKMDKSDPLVWRKPFYWKENDDTPFCPHCYEEFKRRYHVLVKSSIADSVVRSCTHCKSVF
jgi:regulator of replication initiation timing